MIKNSPMFGKSILTEIRDKISEALKGKFFSEEIKKLLSEVKTRKFFFKKIKAKISITLSKRVIVYLQILLKQFLSMNLYLI